MIAVKFTLELGIELSFPVPAAVSQLVTDLETKTHRREPVRAIVRPSRAQQGDPGSGMPAAERSATPPLIPPEDVVDAVLDLVRDDTRSGSGVELWGGERPQHVPSIQRPVY
jgi:hypothetical protein